MNQSELLRSLIARFPERAPRRLCRIQSVPDWCQAFHYITGLSFLETKPIDSGAFMVGRLCIKEVRPVANLIRLAMQRGLGGSPHERLHQDKESAPLVKTL
ncbi:hypothetical protein [Moorena sp. SIO4G3]|uniref:hypothetical protein n=1 Tax=Moorena sp. SIO4G3 TaxID=2607821 RepID=UPI00142CA186|nr:hypothetical protein [Moorena sp. SIO4G3]NEO82351.1 hypothetical protein [Moorena sp. SIO4G3]